MYRNYWSHLLKVNFVSWFLFQESNPSHVASLQEKPLIDRLYRLFECSSDTYSIQNPISMIRITGRWDTLRHHQSLPLWSLNAWSIHEYLKTDKFTLICVLLGGLNNSRLSNKFVHSIWKRNLRPTNFRWWWDHGLSAKLRLNLKLRRILLNKYLEKKNGKIGKISK